VRLRRILVIACLGLLNSMALEPQPMQQAMAQGVPERQSAGAAAPQGEQSGRRIRRLTEDLVQASAKGPIDAAGLQLSIEELRGAVAAYAAELGAADGSGSTGLTGQQAQRPIAPKRLEQPSSESRLDLDAHAREETLRGTHLSPSPEEMRARVQADTSRTNRARIDQITALLSDLERTASAEPAGRQQRVNELVLRLEALTATLPP
jgi:hypothetical protein